MERDDLHGLRVLVTRPQPQAQDLARKIVALGGVPRICPMLEIVPLRPPQAGWWQGFDWIVFVSANAVRAAVAAGLPRQLDARLAAIGPATASALKKAAFPVACQAPPPYTSESLLSLPEFAAPGGKRVLIVRGEGGRELLAKELERRGSTVAHLELYRRRPPRREIAAALQDGLRQGLDAVLATSGEILANLQKAAGTMLLQLRQLPLIVASPRLARMAQRDGFVEVVTAASVSDEAMLATLKQHFANR